MYKNENASVFFFIFILYNQRGKQALFHLKFYCILLYFTRSKFHSNTSCLKWSSHIQIKIYVKQKDHFQNAVPTTLFSKYINKGLDMKAILFMARF